MAKKLLSISVSGSFRTNFGVGEFFDASGVVVTAHYSGGSSARVYTFLYGPQGPLTESDSSIGFSYTEGGITKAANLPITVSGSFVRLISLSLFPDAVVYEGAPTADCVRVSAELYDGQVVQADPTGIVLSPATLSQGQCTVTVSFQDAAHTLSATIQLQVPSLPGPVPPGVGPWSALSLFASIAVPVLTLPAPIPIPFGFVYLCPGLPVLSSLCPGLPRGWKLSVLEFLDAHGSRYVDADGRVWPISQLQGEPAAGFVPRLGAVLRSTEAGHSLEFPDGSTRSFDTTGKLIGRARFGGVSSMFLSYDALGRLSSVASGGSSLVLSYGQEGLLSAVSASYPSCSSPSSVSLSVLIVDGLLCGVDRSLCPILRISHSDGLPEWIRRPGLGESVRLIHSRSLAHGVRLARVESGTEAGGTLDISSSFSVESPFSRDGGPLMLSFDVRPLLGPATRTFFSLDGSPASSFEVDQTGLLSPYPRPGTLLNLGCPSAGTTVDGCPTTTPTSPQTVDLSSFLTDLEESVSPGVLTAILSLYVRLNAPLERPQAALSYRGEVAKIDLDRLAIGCFVPVSIPLPADLDPSCTTAVLTLPDGCDTSAVILSPSPRETSSLTLPSGASVSLSSVSSASTGGEQSALPMRPGDVTATLFSVARGGERTLFFDSMRHAIKVAGPIYLSHPNGTSAVSVAALCFLSVTVLRHTPSSGLNPEEAHVEAMVYLDQEHVVSSSIESRPAGAMYPTAMQRSSETRCDGYGRTVSVMSSPWGSDPIALLGLSSSSTISYGALGLPSTRTVSCADVTSMRTLARDSSGGILSESLPGGGALGFVLDALGTKSLASFRPTPTAPISEASLFTHDQAGRPTSTSFGADPVQDPSLMQTVSHDGFGFPSSLRGPTSGISLSVSRSLVSYSDWGDPPGPTRFVRTLETSLDGTLESLLCADPLSPSGFVPELRVRRDAHGIVLSTFVDDDTYHDEGNTFEYATVPWSPAAAPLSRTKNYERLPTSGDPFEWATLRDAFGREASSCFIHRRGGDLALASYAAHFGSTMVYYPFSSVANASLGPVIPQSGTCPVPVLRIGEDDVEYSVGPGALGPAPYYQFSAYHTHDGLGRICDIWSGHFGSASETFLYGPDGLLSGRFYVHSAYAGMTRARSLSESLSRDGRGRLLSAERAETGSPTVRFEWTYDDVGRVASELLLVGGSATRGTSYSYDQDGRLLLESDALTASATSYAYGPGHRLLTISRGGVAVASFSYDALGRRSVRSAGGPPRSYAYRLGALSEISWWEGDARKAISLSRSAEGRLCRKDLCGLAPAGYSSVEYYWDGARLIALRAERVSGGADHCVFYHDELGPAGMAWVRDGDPLSPSHFRFLRNALGDVEELIDQEGETAVAYGYDAWGLPKAPAIPASGSARSSVAALVAYLNPFRYRGYFYDQDVGLYFLGSRLYDPEVRQFTSPDSPDFLELDRPGGVNPYVYCFNDPITYSDASGHFPIIAGVLIGLGALALTGLGLMIGGKISSNDVLTNIGDSIVSGAETIAGITLIATGAGTLFGMGLLGTGVGSVANGLINMTNGGSYHAGWAGGQLAGGFSFIPYFGGAIGSFFGSAFSDLIDGQYDWDSIDWEKATASAAVSFGLSWFGNAISWGASTGFYSLGKATSYALSYDYALLGISNSILNVWWYRKKKSL